MLLVLDTTQSLHGNNLASWHETKIFCTDGGYFDAFNSILQTIATQIYQNGRSFSFA